MTQITVTEALSEINLIKKKVTAKQEKIQGMLTRVEHLADPFASDGGSPQVIKNEYQALYDLQRRLMKIRAAISSANLENTITIGLATYTIHDWLIWKREVRAGHIGFVSAVNRLIKTHLDQQSRQPQVYKDEAGAVQLVKTSINIDYPTWLKYEAEMTEMTEKLDGQLSLKNATILVEV